MDVYLLRSRVVLDRSKREFGCRSPGRAVAEPDHNQTQSSDLSGDISFWVLQCVACGCENLSEALGSAHCENLSSESVALVALIQ